MIADRAERTAAKNLNLPTICDPCLHRCREAIDDDVCSLSGTEGGRKMPVHRSKYLSLILRHQPETIGLTLDEADWADIDDLVARSDFTREELRQIAAANCTTQRIPRVTLLTWQPLQADFPVPGPRS